MNKEIPNAPPPTKVRNTIIRLMVLLLVIIQLVLGMQNRYTDRRFVSGLQDQSGDGFPEIRRVKRILLD